MGSGEKHQRGPLAQVVGIKILRCELGPAEGRGDTLTQAGGQQDPGGLGPGEAPWGPLIQTRGPRPCGVGWDGGPKDARWGPLIQTGGAKILGCGRGRGRRTHTEAAPGCLGPWDMAAPGRT